VSKRPSELSDADRLAIAAALIRHDLEHASYLRSNRTRVFVSIDGNDPPEAWLRSLPDAVPFSAGTEFELGKGMRMSIGGFHPMSDGTVHVEYGFFCGELCEGSQTAWVERRGDRWHVIRTQLNSVS
jgi:hypothetical protein